MREFSEIAEELSLEKFLATAISTLHYAPEGGVGEEAPMVMVRQFHTELMPPALVAPFAEINAAMAEWVASRAFMAALVTVPPPLEVGRDFISRTFFSYGHSTSSYDDGEADPPRELVWMRDEAHAAMGSAQTERDTLLEPSGKVFFEDQHFIVIEPHVSADELRRWAELSRGSD